VIAENIQPFGRLVTSMVTPFDKEYNIDYPALERMVEHVIETGAGSIVVCATCGESPTLEEEELSAVLSRVLAAVGGRVKVLMGGASSNSTSKAVKLSQVAEKLGANGLLSVVPYYNKPSQAGLYEHFAAIAQATSLPIMLYNIPLAEAHSNIVAIKDCFGSTDQAAEIVRLAPPKFLVYTGDDHLILPMLAIGACGVVSTAGNIMGKSIGEMIQLFLQGEFAQAQAIYFSCLPLLKGLFIAPNPTCLKYALAKQGLCAPYLRLPLVALSENQKAELEALLKISPIDPVAIPASITAN
jgi:4-hydroxy-tetrahydrodipicolinate synthase